MEVGSGVLHAEAPVGSGLSFVTLHFEGLGCSVEGFQVGEASCEATAGEDAELDFGRFNRLPGLGV